MNLSYKMSNGASAKDWLGTAKTAAEVAALMIERTRENSDAAHLVVALEYLEQARLEIVAVQTAA